MSEQNQQNQDDGWEDYRVVNDPKSGKTLPNEGHAGSFWIKKKVI
jgi:hypothetical protein